MKMDNWTKVMYNGLETNVEVTQCGKVRRVQKDWLVKTFTNYKIGEIDLINLKLNSSGYKQLKIQVKGTKGTSVQVHQLVAAAFLDYQFNGFKLVVDHKDSNKLNNHISNLQIISQRENLSKERTLKSNLPVGVGWNKKCQKYHAQIRIEGKKKWLGLYATVGEASEVYQSKLKEIEG